MDKTEILRIAKENDIRFIRLQFTDIFGHLKNVAITPSQLEKALNNDCMFDGSSIDGFARIEESDMYLYPDPETFTVLPWSKEFGKVARLICDVYTADRKPFEGDPRGVLKRVLKKAESMGYRCNIGPEVEFFLFNTAANGLPTTETNDHVGYFDIASMDIGSNARREMCLALEEMGFEIEASHHECARAQHEIDFKYSEALSAADRVMTFKHTVKVIARNHNLSATFMPKPIVGQAGSGMHINVSLLSGNKNVFFDPNTPDQLSDVAKWFIGGVMKHAKALCAVTNPLVNSYKRLVPGYEAPVYVAWSGKNRSPLIRIPAARGNGTRLELRNPDPSCNPYTAFACILAAGLDGIEKKITPPASVDVNIFDMTEEERLANGISNLPGSLEEAVREFEKSELVKEVLGEHMTGRIIAAKKEEWEAYRTHVSEWEKKRYLSI